MLYDPFSEKLLENFSIIEVLIKINCHIPLVIDPSSLYFNFLTKNEYS